MKFNFFKFQFNSDCCFFVFLNVNCVSGESIKATIVVWQIDYDSIELARPLDLKGGPLLKTTDRYLIVDDLQAQLNLPLI